MNSWMANPTFDTQCAHVLAGYAVVITTKLYWPHHVMLIALLFILYSVVKEFWYDARYELPRQTFYDNVLDFSMYCIGVFIGYLV